MNDRWKPLKKWTRRTLAIVWHVLAFAFLTAGLIPLLVLAALLLSRALPTVRRAGARSMLRAYLSLMLCYGVGNIANDFWIEQVWKRGWTTWQIPNVLEPKVTVAWGLIVLGAAALYAIAVAAQSADTTNATSST